MAREPRRECRFGDPIAVPIAGATAFGEPRSDRDIERWLGLERADHPRQQCFVMLEVTVDHRDQRRGGRAHSLDTRRREPAPSDPLNHPPPAIVQGDLRSEVHPSELPSLKGLFYSHFCLKTKKKRK